MQYRLITPEDLYGIRHAILRPHQTIADCKYPGDHDTDSFHTGVFVDDRLSCIGSFYKESYKDFGEDQQYRLRGMATLAEKQGQGLAQYLIQESLKELQKRKAQILWCNARTSAEGFYVKLNFQRHGEIFDIEGIGPHYVYTRTL